MWIEGLVSENQKINRNNAEADSKHNRKEIGYIFQAFSPNIIGKTDRLESGPVQKITIVPRTMGSLGYVMQVPEEEKYMMTKDGGLMVSHIYVG